MGIEIRDPNLRPQRITFLASGSGQPKTQQGVRWRRGLKEERGGWQQRGVGVDNWGGNPWTKLGLVPGTGTKRSGGKGSK